MNADVRHFLKRASQESLAAEIAQSPTTRRAHLDLADHYRALAGAIESYERRFGRRASPTG